MKQPKGILLAMMEPPAAMEEEFNDWYETEHVPERMSVPGFLASRRFVCLSGWPRYLALYDLESPEVLQSTSYLAVMGKGLSPWTRRVTGRTLGQYRAAGALIHPADGITGKPARLTLVRFSNTGTDQEPAMIAGLQASFGSRPETSQIRLFRAPSGDRTDHIALIEAVASCPDARLDVAAFGAVAGHIDLVNIYAPHWRLGPPPGK